MVRMPGSLVARHYTIRVSLFPLLTFSPTIWCMLDATLSMVAHFGIYALSALLMLYLQEMNLRTHGGQRWSVAAAAWYA